MENLITTNDIVGKTFYYTLPAQNIIAVVVVTGFEEKGDKYLGDSYTGTSTLIFKDGKSYTDMNWSCGREYFEKLNKTRIR